MENHYTIRVISENRIYYLNERTLKRILQPNIKHQYWSLDKSNAIRFKDEDSARKLFTERLNDWKEQFENSKIQIDICLCMEKIMPIHSYFL